MAQVIEDPHSEDLIDAFYAGWAAWAHCERCPHAPGALADEWYAGRDASRVASLAQHKVAAVAREAL